MAIYKTKTENLIKYFKTELNKQLNPTIRSIEPEHLPFLKKLLLSDGSIMINSNNYEISYFMDSINSFYKFHNKPIIFYETLKNIELSTLQKITETAKEYNDFYKDSRNKLLKIPANIFSKYYFSNFLTQPNNFQTSYEYKIYSNTFHILNLNKQLYIPKFNFGSYEEAPISPVNDIESYSQMLAFEHLDKTSEDKQFSYFQTNSPKELVEELLETSIELQPDSIFHDFYNSNSELIFYPDDIISFVKKTKIEFAEAAKKAAEAEKLSVFEKNTSIKDIISQTVDTKIQNELVNIDQLTPDEFINQYFEHYDRTFIDSSNTSIIKTKEYKENIKVLETLNQSLKSKINDLNYFSSYLIKIEQKFQEHFKKENSSLDSYTATLSLLTSLCPYNNKYTNEYFTLIDKHLSLNTITCMSINFYYIKPYYEELSHISPPFHTFKKLRTFNFLTQNTKSATTSLFFEEKLNLFIDNIESSDKDTIEFLKTDIGEHVIITLFPFLKSKNKLSPQIFNLINFSKVRNSNFFGSFPLQVVLNNNDILKEHFKLLSIKNPSFCEHFHEQQHNFALSLYEQSINNSINDFSNKKPDNLDWLLSMNNSNITNMSTMLVKIFDKEPNFINFIEHLYSKLNEETAPTDNLNQAFYKLFKLFASGYINEHKIENVKYNSIIKYNSFIKLFSNTDIFIDFFNNKGAFPCLSEEQSIVCFLLLSYDIENGVSPNFVQTFKQLFQKKPNILKYVEQQYPLNFDQHSLNAIHTIFSDHNILDIIADHHNNNKFYSYTPHFINVDNYPRAEYIHPSFLSNKLDLDWIVKNLQENPISDNICTLLKDSFNDSKELPHSLIEQIFNKFYTSKDEDIYSNQLHKEFISKIFFSKKEPTYYYSQPILLPLINNYNKSPLFKLMPYTLKNVFEYSISDPDILHSFFINKDNINKSEILTSHNKSKQLKF